MKSYVHRGLRMLLCMLLAALLILSTGFAALAADEDGAVTPPDQAETTETTEEETDEEAGEDGEEPEEPEDAGEEDPPVSLTPTLVSKPFIDGNEEHLFLPGAPTTRAAFLKMLVVALCEDFDSDADYGTASFCDVPLDQWYEPYLAYAEMNDLVSGYPDGTFRPNAPISRAEACSMAARVLLANVEEGDTHLDGPFKAKFDDVARSHWAYSSINLMAGISAISGNGKGKFLPDDGLTRAAAVTIVARATPFLPTKAVVSELIQRFPTTPFRDVSTSGWYYPYLLRAVGYVESAVYLEPTDGSEGSEAEEEPEETEPEETEPEETEPEEEGSEETPEGEEAAE